MGGTFDEQLESLWSKGRDWAEDQIATQMPGKGAKNRGRSNGNGGTMNRPSDRQRMAAATATRQSDFNFANWQAANAANRALGLNAAGNPLAGTSTGGRMLRPGGVGGGGSGWVGAGGAGDNPMVDIDPKWLLGLGALIALFLYTQKRKKK